MEYFDYIIIGGGMSGINTVLNLSQKYPNKSIILIESKNRFGGRIFSIYNKKIIFNMNQVLQDFIIITVIC